MQVVASEVVVDLVKDLEAMKKEIMAVEKQVLAAVALDLVVASEEVLA